jgi:hypothetical protein
LILFLFNFKTISEIYEKSSKLLKNGEISSILFSDKFKFKDNKVGLPD